MAADLKSKSARAKLAPRREPYWARVEAGLFVGYRAPETGDGTWIARRREGDGQQYRALGTLGSLDEAVKLTKEWGGAVDSGATHKAVTVTDACQAYVTHQRTHKGASSASDASGRFTRLVFDAPIGKLNLDKLRTTQVKEWMDDQLDEDGDEEDLRKSKDSANRNLNTLKAALNLALKDRLVATDAGWKTCTIYPGVGRRRDRFLSLDERRLLLQHCDGDYLRALVTTLLLTGARPGEIANADAGDLDTRTGTLKLSGKAGQRTVTVSTEALRFLRLQVKSRLPTAPLLADNYGRRWHKDAWKVRIKAAVRAAGLPDDVVLYAIRHTAISELIAGGMDAFIVARLAGTSTAMIDKHYGHLRHESTRARMDSVAML